VSIRLDKSAIRRLDYVNNYANLGRAELIRRAVDNFLEKIEKEGSLTVRAEIPPYRGED